MGPPKLFRLGLLLLCSRPPTSLRLLSLFLHNPSRAVVGSAIAVVATGGWDLVLGSLSLAEKVSVCMHACMCVGIAQVLYVAIDRIPFIHSFFLSLSLFFFNHLVHTHTPVTYRRVICPLLTTSV
ncbi:hypothetical protein BDQ94DRAFT_151385 [Aspergillus welwitschiae]|uniref:Uncharacterized protein n=1 Tax=Aspergillus welwitschiae TaxID=1341132 RepID=A0A3F3PPP5_9EURO|nr:hypothetical protein BDQ94DRAFT_151385 [Aspergillus welwitschiae]RDH28921.1 hypothetical protein BDQ94DRAFT_151385 [Aspergillus welwitschiae]